MIRNIIRNLDPLRHRIPPSNRGIARVYRSVVHTPTLRILEALAGKPVVSPTRLPRRTIGTVFASLTTYIRTRQDTLRKTVFCGLFLGFGGQVSRGQELVYERLVLADAVGEHAAVVAVVVDAPLDCDHVAGLVGRDGF